MPTKTIANYAAINPLEAIRPELAALVGGTTVAGAIITEGDVVGAESLTGLYRRRTVTVAQGAGFATNSRVGEVADAVFLAGDILQNAGGDTIGTVQSVSAGVITLTANAAVAVAAGARVQCVNGAEVARGIADDSADGDGAAQIAVFICGLLKEPRLRGLDDTAKTELGGASVAGDIFKF